MGRKKEDIMNKERSKIIFLFVLLFFLSSCESWGKSNGFEEGHDWIMPRPAAEINLKIVHFTWEYPPVIYGGLGTFATEITQKQKKFGNDITVFSLNENNEYKTQEEWNNIDVYRPKILDLTQTFNLFASHELRAWGNNLKFFADGDFGPVADYFYFAHGRRRGLSTICNLAATAL